MLATLRDRLLLAVLAAIAGFCDLRREQHSAAQGAVSSDAPSVILVVSDGLRWQEVFRGADSLLMFGDPVVLGGDAAGVRRRFWRATAAERRRALMPFVWSTLAREGRLLGNRDLGSSVSVTNGMNFSYPGYNEMLVGYPDAHIDRNDYGPNPNVTVFEWLNRRKDLAGRVAAVGAWSTFADIFNQRRSGLRLHVSRIPPRDARAHAAALKVLQERRPRALFVAYVETDDMAHKGRYDLLLDAVHAVDANLAELWATVQSHPQYRGRTTLIFTADHGRGATPRDWKDHGDEVAGSEQTWIAMMAPGAPEQGEARSTTAATESQVAATVAAALGLDYRREAPRAAEALRGPARPRRN